MSKELYWLTLTALMTALFWLPYIVNRLREMGIAAAVMNPNSDPTPQAQWAARMMRAHSNAIENLAIFAPLVLAVEVTGMATEMTAIAAMTYFYARLAHFFVYTFGVPALRTIAFFVGFLCQGYLALSLLGQ